MKIRPLLFWPHLVAGVIAGGVILVMSVTGVLLTYERQLIAWSDSHFRSEGHGSPGGRMPVEQLLTTIARDHSAIMPTAVTLGSATDAPVMVAAGQRTFYFDAYSGRLLGEASPGVRRFMSSLRSWHRWLAMDGEQRATARVITGWSNVIFLFIILSGMYLWLPKFWTWRHLKPIVRFDGTARGKARDFNWHNAIGLWSAVPLFLVVLTAVPISFSWASSAIYRMVGEAPPASTRNGAPRQAQAAPRTHGADGLNELSARAQQQVAGWRTITVRLSAPDAPVAFVIDSGDGGQPQRRSTLTLSRSGDVVMYESFADQSLGRRLRSIARFGHTGEVLGIAGQTVAGLVTLGSVVLVYTGVALALRRYWAWRKRRAGRSGGLAQEQQSNAA